MGAQGYCVVGEPVILAIIADGLMQPVALLTSKLRATTKLDASWNCLANGDITGLPPSPRQTRGVLRDRIGRRETRMVALLRYGKVMTDLLDFH